MVVAALVLAVGIVWSIHRFDERNAEMVAGGSELGAPQAEEPHTVLVIGDSWTEGGSMNSGPTWPFLMGLPEGWNVLADGAGGTGYIGDHSDSALTYNGRLDTDLQKYAPDVVLVAMGRNDVQWSPDKVVAAARADLTKMTQAWPDAKIVVFSPFSPEPPVEWTVTLTDRLRALAGSLGLRFLDVSNMIGDRSELIELKHPNDAGHALLARSIRAGLDDLNVLD